MKNITHASTDMFILYIFSILYYKVSEIFSTNCVKKVMFYNCKIPSAVTRSADLEKSTVLYRRKVPN